jgi:DNA-binding NarL/FixJ family response regulator
MEKIKVIIADDHLMVREGLKQIIELQDDITVVSQASDGEEAIQLINQYNPDVVLMDINMPVKNGIQALKELKQKNNPSKVIMLTFHQDREYLIKTKQLGASGYVLKDAEPQVLIEAIRSVGRNSSVIKPDAANSALNESDDTNDELSQSKLTVREIEVLGLIAEGLLNKEIASKLYISEKTVKNHISSIFRKLDVSDRTQAAIYAYKNRIK